MRNSKKKNDVRFAQKLECLASYCIVMKAQESTRTHIFLPPKKGSFHLSKAFISVHGDVGNSGHKNTQPGIFCACFNMCMCLNGG